MNWQQRFLWMFADYRDMAERLQRAQDEILAMRGAKEAAEQRLADVKADALKREREITDRYMRMSMGQRAVDPNAATPEPQKSNPTEESPQDWKRRMWGQFHADLQQRQELLNGGPGAASTN